jgi:hypothetical protein
MLLATTPPRQFGDSRRLTFDMRGADRLAGQRPLDGRVRRFSHAEPLYGECSQQA